MDLLNSVAQHYSNTCSCSHYFSLSHSNPISCIGTAIKCILLRLVAGFKTYVLCRSALLASSAYHFPDPHSPQNEDEPNRIRLRPALESLATCTCNTQMPTQ